MGSIYCTSLCGNTSIPMEFCNYSNALNVCTGCFRTKQEIEQWTKLSRQEQAEVVKNAIVRFNSFALLIPPEPSNKVQLNDQRRKN